MTKQATEAAGRTTQRGAHEVAPLPFDPRKLNGISERMIVSHHDNNYAAAVKNLNKVEEDLTHIPMEAPAIIWGGLKDRELVFSNSMILHENYFGNLGGSGKPTATMQRVLGDVYGTFGRWEEEFRATGVSLGGGSGWVVLDLNLHNGSIRTYWSGNHTQALASAVPLLVMDMYEHAYQMDFGAAAARYIDTFFKNIQWEEVERRYERAQRAISALR